MRSILLIVIFGFVSLPGWVSAQGFVPCSGVNCSACNLFQMGSSILTWLIGILFLLFAFMVFVAGWKLISSGGNTSAKEAAKSQLTNAIIGIIIVLAAWLIVDTLMRALLSGGTGTISGYGPWQEIQCGAQTSTNWVVAQNYSSITTGWQSCGGAGQPSCASLVSQCSAGGGTASTTPGAVSCTTAVGVATSTASVAACDTSQMQTINFMGQSVTVDTRLVSRLQAADAAWRANGGNSYYQIRSIGSYSCRQNVNNPSRPSFHAYGFAVDINPPPPGSNINGNGPFQSPCPTDMNSQSPPFYTLMTGQGFGWGGNWRSLCDAMHFSAGSPEGGWLPRP